MVTLVRLVGVESPNTNVRDAVWNGHAGEIVAAESGITNARNAVADGQAGEAR